MMRDELTVWWRILTWHGIGIIIFGWLVVGRLLCWVWRGCWLDYRRKAWQRMADFHATASTSWPRGPAEQVPFLGFFATVLGIALVSLNVLLLGQAMELVAAGGRRVGLGWFGKYDILAVATAIIFILAQVFLGHVSLDAHFEIQNARERVKLTKLPGWGAFSLLGLAVVVETVVGTLRAYYLSIGYIPVAPTLMDEAMMRGGPFIVGLVSLIIPCTEVAAGVVSIDLYASVNWKVWNRRLKALWLWFWAGVLWWLFPRPRTGSSESASEGGDQND